MWVSSEWHGYVTSAYRAARAAQDQRRDEYANGYRADEKLFYQEIESPVTFKDILIQSKGYGDHE